MRTYRFTFYTYPEGGEYVAVAPFADLHGFGATKEAACADLLDTARQHHDEIALRGPERVSARLWKLQPKVEALIAALERLEHAA